MSGHWDVLVPLLVHIQARLDEDLSTRALGHVAELSPSHLHRLFTAVIGETPHCYVTRLRLERAAFSLLTLETTLLDLALACGYRNHETFTRAFRRRFGKSPREYRTWIRTQTARAAAAPALHEAAGAASPFALSATRVARLRPAHVAFIRHVGPYERVPPTLFAQLETWARRRRVRGPRVWMGIGHDAPMTTAAERLRFDAALVVPEPFDADGRVGCQYLDVGEVAITHHAGPFATLPAAYGQIFPRALATPGYRFVGLPAVEIYQTGRVNARRRLNHTDICLPIERHPGRMEPAAPKT